MGEKDPVLDFAHRRHGKARKKLGWLYRLAYQAVSVSEAAAACEYIDCVLSDYSRAWHAERDRIAALEAEVAALRVKLSEEYEATARDEATIAALRVDAERWALIRKLADEADTKHRVFGHKRVAIMPEDVSDFMTDGPVFMKYAIQSVQRCCFYFVGDCEFTAAVDNAVAARKAGP